MNGQEIYDLESLPCGAELLIYGAGGAGAKLFEYIQRERQDLTVLAFVDTYKKSGKHCAKEIINVDKINQHYHGKYIVVASVYHKEISNELLKRGIENFSIYTDYSEDYECYSDMCKVALKVEDNVVRFNNGLPDIKTLRESTLIYNFPVDADSSKKNSMRLGLEEGMYATTNILDKSFAQIDRFISSSPSDVINVIDVEGDQIHLTKLVAHLCELKIGSIVVWKQPNNIKAIVSIDKHKISYVPIPKCGSTSIINLLRTNFEDYFDEHCSEHRVRTVNSLLFHADVTNECFRGHRFFTVTRNPYTRLASLYNSRIKSQKYIFPALRRNYGDYSFETFVRFVSNCPDAIAEHHFKSQAYFLTIEGNVLLDAEIIPLEKSSRLQTFLSEYIPTVSVCQRNRSRGKGQNYITQYYTPELIRLVNQRYATDFEICNYQMC